MKLAVALGVAYQVDKATVKKYKEYGIDLEEASGQKHHLLPVPGVFLLDKFGKIQFQYFNRIAAQPNSFYFKVSIIWIFELIDWRLRCHQSS